MPVELVFSKILRTHVVCRKIATFCPAYILVGPRNDAGDVVVCCRSLSTIFAALQHLRLGSNPLHCGCEAVWLMEMYERSSDVFKGASQPSCASPARLRGQHFNELSLSDFRCQVTTTATSCAFQGQRGERCSILPLPLDI